LKSFLPQYFSLIEDLSKIASDPRALKGIKDWIIKTVFPKFVSHFDSAGPNGPSLDSLKTVRIYIFISMPFVNSPPSSGNGHWQGGSRTEPTVLTSKTLRASPLLLALRLQSHVPLLLSTSLQKTMPCAEETKGPWTQILAPQTKCKVSGL